jgi:phosphoglucomutase
VWTTDKDGLIPCLLSAEMTARLKRDPGELYRELTRDLGDAAYERIDVPVTPEQRAALEGLSAADLHVTEVASERVEQILTAAPGDGSPIGG